MGSSVSFYCGPEDDQALREQAKSIGLDLVPAWLDKLDSYSDANAERNPFSYLTFLPIDELHPYGKPPVNIGDAIDPLIEFLRAYYDPPYLVSGRIYWSTDVKSLAAKTKPYYTKLARWVRKNWTKRSDSSFYFGPQAARLVEEHGAKPVTFHPDKTKLQKIYI